MTVYVALKGGQQDAYHPRLGCGRCGSYDLEQKMSGRIWCHGCSRGTDAVPVDPAVEELEDGGLAVEGSDRRLARYTKGVWLSYRYASDSEELNSDPNS